MADSSFHTRHFERHYSLFPWSDAMLAELGDDLKPYAVGKGTIRFPANEPILLELVARITGFRIREVAEELQSDTP